MNKQIETCTANIAAFNEQDAAEFSRLMTKSNRQNLLGTAAQVVVEWFLTA